MPYGAISAGHPLTAEAAAQCLDAGGNAIDAAVSAAFTACVVEPVLASLGGGGFILLGGNNQKPQLFDFFTQTPLHQLPREEADFYSVELDFGITTQMFHVGLGSVATPGMVRGLFDAHRQHGKLPMPVVLEYAIAKAKEGVSMSGYQAYICSLVEPILMQNAISRQLFESKIEPGRCLRKGECLRMEKLADLFASLAFEGDDLFYLGEVASEIQSLQEKGGQIGKEDLKQYRTEIRHPLDFTYRQHQIITNSPPAAGGTLIAFAMQILAASDLSVVKNASIEHLTLLSEIMELTNAARIEAVIDGQHHPHLDQLLAGDLIQKYRAQVSTSQPAWRGTTQVSIIDTAGNAISMTLSNGEGCGTVLPQSGFMLNNMLGEEDLNPHGFFHWQPGQRMSSMMSPTLVRRPDGGLIATGSGGSNRIRTAIMQVLVNLIDFKLPVDQAVCNPRIHAEDGMLNIEGGVDDVVAESLCQLFSQHKRWQEQNMFFGGVHTVISNKCGFNGCGDPRRGGVFVDV